MKTNNKVHFEFLVHLEYHRDHDCDQHGCHDEGICRCSTIEDAKVDGLSHPYQLYDKLMQEVYGTNDGCLYPEINIYCMERWFSHKLSKKEFDFEINICGGYYGQEIEGVYMNEKHFNEVVRYLEFLQNCESDYEKLETVLKQEYGFVLETLKKKEVEIRTISEDDVVVEQRDYYKRIRLDHRYIQDALPLGVYILKNKKYKLVDGYHRLKQWREQKKSGKGGKFKAVVIS